VKDPIQAILAAQKELLGAQKALDDALHKLLAGEITCSEAHAAAKRGSNQAKAIVKRAKRGWKAGGRS
jgi:hypothetical protein